VDQDLRWPLCEWIQTSDDSVGT